MSTANRAIERLALVEKLRAKVKRLEQENRELRRDKEQADALAKTLAAESLELHEKAKDCEAEHPLEPYWLEMQEALRALSMVALQTPLYQADPDLREAVDAGLALTVQATPPTRQESARENRHSLTCAKMAAFARTGSLVTVEATECDCGLSEAAAPRPATAQDECDQLAEDHERAHPTPAADCAFCGTGTLARLSYEHTPEPPAGEEKPPVDLMEAIKASLKHGPSKSPRKDGGR